MNKLAYWFLDIAIEEAIVLNWVIPEKIGGLLVINRVPLPLSVSEVANILHKLFHTGNLLATTSKDQKNLAGFTQGFQPSLAAIEAALKGDIFMLYCLTAKGAESWESLSQPKWEQYFNWNIGKERENEETITCGSRQTAETILSLYHLLGSGASVQYIIPHTEIWETIIPWKATYWKTLPVGYQVRFQKRNIEIDHYPQEPPDFIHKKRQAREVYLSLRKWYKNYFKEQG